MAKVDPSTPQVSLLPKNIIGLTRCVAVGALTWVWLCQTRSHQDHERQKSMPYSLWLMRFPLLCCVLACVFACVCVNVCLCTHVLYALVFSVCLHEYAYLVRKMTGGKRLTFPHSRGHLGHARGLKMMHTCWGEDKGREVAWKGGEGEQGRKSLQLLAELKPPRRSVTGRISLLRLHLFKACSLFSSSGDE